VTVHEFLVDEFYGGHARGERQFVLHPVTSGSYSSAASLSVTQCVVYGRRQRSSISRGDEKCFFAMTHEIGGSADVCGNDRSFERHRL
jgi:hypothetical protein